MPPSIYILSCSLSSYLPIISSCIFLIITSRSLLSSSTQIGIVSSLITIIHVLSAFFSTQSISISSLSLILLLTSFASIVVSLRIMHAFSIISCLICLFSTSAKIQLSFVLLLCSTLFSYSNSTLSMTHFLPHLTYHASNKPPILQLICFSHLQNSILTLFPKKSLYEA